MKAIVTGALASFILFSGSALAGDAEAGKGLANTKLCYTCHGMDGVAISEIYPNLKGQNEKYIISSLKAYKSKQRNGGLSALMQPYASTLSDGDIDNLAAYFSSLK